MNVLAKILTVPEEILKAFKDAGLELKFFEENEENKALWQYDGRDHGNNVTIQFTVGLNGRMMPSLFGEYYSNSDECYSLSGPMKYWMQDFSKYIPMMAKGEDFKW